MIEIGDIRWLLPGSRLFFFCGNGVDKDTYLPFSGTGLTPKRRTDHRGKKVAAGPVLVCV
jgi:hypothetical protein